MPNAQRAQRLLTVAISKQQASSIVGDVLEQTFSKMGFWLTITRVLFALVWRWVLGSLAAPIMMGCAYILPWVIPRPEHLTTASMPWQRTELLLQLAAAVLASSSVLALIRYGVRNSLTGLSIVLTTVVLTSTCVIPRVPPAKAIAVIVLVLITVFLSFLWKATQPAAICVTSAAVVQAIVFNLFGMTFTRIFSGQLWFTARGSNLHDIVLLIVMIPPTILAGAYVLARLRPRLVMCTTDQACDT